MLTLHHLENSQSIRILWLLEELGIPYEFKMYDRNPETMLAPDEYKKVSPLGTAPVITDGDVTLAESNAIIEYILDTYAQGRLRPAAGTPDRAAYLFWFHASQGSFTPLLTMGYIFGRITSSVPFFLKPIIGGVMGQVQKLFLQPRIQRFMGEVERQLAKTKWFAGDEITAADVAMSYCMEVGSVSLDDFKKYPNAKRYLKQLRETPSYKAAMEKDGKFNPLPR